MKSQQVLTNVLALLILVLALLLIVSVARAQSDSDYALSWWTVDSGGTSSTSGGYTLGGAAGQPDVGESLTSGLFTVGERYKNRYKRQNPLKIALRRMYNRFSRSWR